MRRAVQLGAARWFSSCGAVVLAAACLGFAVAGLGCAQEEYPAALWALQHPEPDASSSTATTVTSLKGPQTCVQARGTSYPQRLVALSATASTGPTVVTVDQVFAGFQEVCGGCHSMGSSDGNFQILTVTDFQTGFTQTQLTHVMSSGPSPGDPAGDPNDPNDPMPPFSSPNGKPFSQRTGDDPVLAFAKLAGEWLAAGSPSSFTPGGADAGATGAADGGTEGGAGTAQYHLPTPVGVAMTNIGDCIPSPALIGTQQAQMAQLDAMFASLSAQTSGSAAQVIGLPDDLAQTDLTTFDTRTLAENGVIAYAPGYPLWSDNAGKLRYIRVPLGTSVQFNKATQSWVIPPNTRFYKTFMKQIIDTDGSIRWRKVETRLIVARPNLPGLTGPSSVAALFGTYLWNDDESDATLANGPLRDGEPWADQLLEYNTDEQLAALIQSTNPLDPSQALLLSDAARHYAVPGSTRCIQCHEGSANDDFVLGFLPLQISRRPVGEGGVIEATGPDELTQLQRFIDDGLITGLSSPSDVLPLEQSEGTRTPRNDNELVAQGYMLGNCSHCHNPRGEPSVENPVLAPILDFLPTPTSGIFQFSLETYSPRIFRGLTGSTQIPYITPSLMDQPRHDPGKPNLLTSSQTAIGSPSSGTADIVYAPWRSLIYRNTDTAFSYTDDYGLFPHMPRNTPGYDPRTKEILADWMVSIPALLKNPQLAEYAFCAAVDCDPTNPNDSTLFLGVPDETPQPYVEVLPGDTRYAAAQEAALTRLGILHSGLNSDIPLSPDATLYSRYQDQGNTTDIVDPNTIADPVCYPVPEPQFGLPPRHPDWVDTDLTEPPGYSPRRTDWASVLVTQTEQDTGDLALSCTGGGSAADQGAFADEQAAVAAVQTVSLDAAFHVFPTNPLSAAQDTTFRTWATTAIPYGLWEQQSGCNFASIPTVGSISASAAPRWFSLRQDLAPTAPVYSQAPGQAVFKTICINCHGPLADGNGRLAANLADMTGGQAIVADFRDGFMGPVGASADQTNRHLTFGTAALPAQAPSGWINDLTDDDRAARYMGWMALGGTQKVIPQAILQIVSLTQVLGERRPYLPAATISANMLSTAKSICQSFLGPGQGTVDSLTRPKGVNPSQGVYGDPSQGVIGDLDGNPTLIHDNGDAETWFRLCTGGHLSPVHALQVAPATASIAGGDCSPVPPLALKICEEPVYNTDLTLAAWPGISAGTSLEGALIDPTTYPPNTPVGNALGGVDPSLTDDNPWPWCLSTSDAGAKTFAASQGWPLCPTGVSMWTTSQMSAWAVRGAINAGMSVFLYVEQLESMSGPPVDYDSCEDLSASASSP